MGFEVHLEEIIGYYFTTYFEIVIRLKALGTELAFETALLLVEFQVLTKVGLLRKRDTALFAFEMLFAGVDQ